MRNVVDSVKAPAIGLMIVGILNGVTGILTLLGGAVRLTGILGRENLPVDEAERTGFLIGTAVGYGIAVVGLLAAPLIFYGGFRMLNGTSDVLARTSAILAIVPLVSCCFVAGIPVGVWALMVLNRPDVKALFSDGPSYGQSGPPSPPRFG